MNKIKAVPYKLIGKVQHYEWGSKNENAFIPKLLGFEPVPDLPYAEYWIGAHSKAPSEVLTDNTKISLDKFIAENPVEILGKTAAEKFNNTLPFLFKILSINQALSIQAHPDKALAKELHRRDPENYPDSNHKPEIAIAIDKLTAIVGLKEINELREALHKYPEITSLIGGDLFHELIGAEIPNAHVLLKKMYSQLMNVKDEKLVECIEKLKDRFEKEDKLSKPEQQFLAEYKNYGIDVGLISILFFNWIELKAGEAIFTEAGVPHAYIKGNIIECMANSDNVVRAGLTPKFKDVNTLTEMLKVDKASPYVEVNEEEKSISYEIPAQEFHIKKIKLSDVYSQTKNNSVNIVFVLEGKVEIECENGSLKLSKGETALIPALLDSFQVTESSESEVYFVSVPQ